MRFSLLAAILLCAVIPGQSTATEARALVVVDGRLHQLIQPDMAAYVRAAEGRRGFPIAILPVDGIDDWQPPRVRDAIGEWRQDHPKLEGILFVGNIKLPSFFMPRPDIPETRLWPRYYEDLQMKPARRIAAGTVLYPASTTRPAWPVVAGDVKQFTVPEHDFDDLEPGSPGGTQIWTAYLPVGFADKSRNRYEGWAGQLRPFFRKALAFYEHPERYERSLYIVSNDAGVLERASAAWEALGPKQIEYYSINEKGPGAFKDNPAGYLRADLAKYATLKEFLAHARTLPWMDEGWQSPQVFVSHMQAGRRRIVCWNVHSNPELSLVNWKQARDMENGGLIAVMLGCGVAGFKQPNSPSHVDTDTPVEKNVLVNVVYGRSAFTAAVGDPFARVTDAREGPFYRTLYLDRDGYLGKAHLNRMQEPRAVPPGELRQRQEILIGDPFVDAAISPRNIAKSATYTVDPRPNYGYCTDPEDVRQLTDGQYTSGYFWTQKSTVGWQHASPVILTLDLGRVQPIRGISYNTAAGVAGVEWPRGIDVLFSDDGRTFHHAGELVALSAKRGQPPARGYAVHRYWTDDLRAHGRYVAVIVTATTYAFVDEIEVYLGEPEWVTLAPAGEAVGDLRAFHRATCISRSVTSRLHDDARAVQQLAGPLPVAREIRDQVQRDIEGALADLAGMPRPSAADFRAVLPLNDPHRRIFRAQATLWRASGVPPLLAWQSPAWAPLPHIGVPPKDAPAAVNVTMMRNEYRAAAFNLSNSGGADLVLRLQLADLPGGANPGWIAVHEVQWTDTRSGEPVAAALPLATRDGDSYLIHVPSGLTRQVWLNLHPVDVAQGTHRGRIVLSGAAQTVESPLQVRISEVRFPDRPTLHLGGWDYTDADSRYEINPANRDAVLAHLREHYVDSPWATSAVLPRGKHDPEGNMTEPPDTARFDEWLRRWPEARQYCVFAAVDERFGTLAMGTPAFETAVKAWAGFWADHARRKGLRPEQLNLLLVDEPHGPEQDRVILAWATAIRSARTGVRIWEDPTHADPATADARMMAACDVLCPNRPMFLGNTKYRDYFARRRPATTELAFYSCSGPVRQLDPYAYHRLQAWTCWEQGAKSEYFWAFGDGGGGSSWNEYSARGSAYTPFFLDATSVTAGKHMEAIREGIEDYEYLVMLRDRIARARERNADRALVDAAQRLLGEAAGRVCGGKQAESLWWRDERDRTAADRVRLEILAMIEKLQ